MTNEATQKTPSAEPEFSILHRQAHRLLRLNRDARDSRWVGASITVSLVAAELPAAAVEYPCVFTRAASGSRLVAVTGLEHGRNLFVDASGQWNGEYTPAVVRTWPFRLLEQVDAEGARLVAVHRPALQVGEGEPLFDEQGQELPWLKATLQELTALDAGAAGTAAAVAALEEAGVLQERSLQAVLSNGRQLELTGFLVVDEARLNALGADQLGKLHVAGALSLAYLHLLSLRRFRALIERASRQDATAANE